MSVQDLLFFLDSTNDVDVTIRNDDCLWIVRKIVKVTEFLYLIRLILEIEKVCMSLFYRENRNFLDLIQKIRWLSDRNSSLISLSSSSIVNSGDSIAQNFG